MFGEYLGGRIGKKGGFLTSVEHGGKVGDAAFAMLEFGYEINEKISLQAILLTLYHLW